MGERWAWLDIDLSAGESEVLSTVGAQLQLDSLAVRDAIDDNDLPKLNDFGDHLLVVLHGLRDGEVGTYELDCFLTANHLVTVHRERSPSIDALWKQLQASPGLAAGGADQLLGRLADVVSRRMHSVLAVCEDRLDDLTALALTADDSLLEELTAVRQDLGQVRRVVHPQRDVLDQLRTNPSHLISEEGRRRFGDVFDVASRSVHELESVRTVLAETLDAYRGAEARQATDVTMVLTVYAAVLLPLTLITGFFGMNFVNLPGQNRPWAWPLVTGIMVGLTALSLSVFVALGWIHRPSSRRVGSVLGRGLIEATRAPAHIATALFESSTLPGQAANSKAIKRDDPPDPDS